MTSILETIKAAQKQQAAEAEAEKAKQASPAASPAGIAALASASKRRVSLPGTNTPEQQTVVPKKTINPLAKGLSSTSTPTTTPATPALSSIEAITGGAKPEIIEGANNEPLIPLKQPTLERPAMPPSNATPNDILSYLVADMVWNCEQQLQGREPIRNLHNYLKEHPELELSLDGINAVTKTMQSIMLGAHNTATKKKTKRETAKTKRAEATTQLEADKALFSLDGI